MGMGAVTGRRCRIALALLVIGSGIGLASPKALQGGQVTRAYAEAERVTCGPRTVFVVARKLGCEVTYESIRRGMSLTDDGATIHDVKRALNDLGIACSVRRLDLTQLLSCPTPLIAHVRLRGQNLFSAGHYLVATEIGPEGIRTFDAYEGRDAFWRWQDFSDRFTGFAAIPETSGPTSPSGLALAALAVHLVAFVGLFSSIRTGLRSVPALTRRGRDVVQAILIVAATVLLGSPAVGAGEGLRSDSNDGRNAAALLGGMCGVQIAPGDAAGGGACRTLEGVQSLLADHGIATHIRYINYDDLIKNTGPCILPLRYGKDGSGNFYVLVYANSKQVTVVRAGLLVVSSISVDEFRRRWTGHAILPARDDSRYAYPSAAAGAVTIIALAYAAGRRGHRAAMRTPQDRPLGAFGPTLAR